MRLLSAVLAASTAFALAACDEVAPPAPRGCGDSVDLANRTLAPTTAAPTTAAITTAAQKTPAQNPHVSSRLGIDVAHHQGDIDWPAVAASGVRFVWIKATEGGDYVDPAFRRNWLLADAAGLRRGAYHFVYWCRPAADQANWFIANVPADPDALPPVLDIEWTPESRTCPGKVAREPALAAIKVMLDAMERAYGVRPIIYVPGDMFRDVVAGSFEGYPLWVRGLNGRPHVAYGLRRWSVWQYAEHGHVPGIEGDVDLDCMADRSGPRG